FQPSDHTRDSTLRQMRHTQQRLECGPDPAAVDPAQVTAENRLVDLPGPSSVAWQQRALKFSGGVLLADQTTARHFHGLRALGGRHRAFDGAVPIAAPLVRALVASRRKGGRELLDKRHLKGFPNVSA